ncbi:MAG: hypothetical protein IJ806_08265 [Ruminococcus sp.]|nr:hypothetical protein [Ruminococcus sp.]
MRKSRCSGIGAAALALAAALVCVGCEWDGYADSGLDPVYTHGSSRPAVTVPVEEQESGSDSSQQEDLVTRAKMTVALWFESYSEGDYEGCKALSTDSYNAASETDRLFNKSWPGSCEIGFYGFPEENKEGGRTVVTVNFQASPEKEGVEPLLCRAAVVFEDGDGGEETGRVDLIEEVEGTVMASRRARERAKELYRLSVKYIDYVNSINYGFDTVSDPNEIGEQDVLYFTGKILPGDGMHHSDEVTDFMNYLRADFFKEESEIADIAIKDGQVLYVYYEKDGVSATCPES